MRLAFLLALLALSIAACAVEPSLGVTRSSSTTCVSDPLAPGDGDSLLPRCRPTQAQLQQAASVYAASHYPPPSSRANGGCGYAPSGHLVCILDLNFGGTDLFITCAEQDDGSILCLTTDNGEIQDI